MKFAFALIATASATELMTETNYKFMEFVTFHQRSFATKAEYEFRQAIFSENLKFVEEFNAKNLSSTVEVNHLADRTETEKKALLGFKKMPTTADSRVKTFSEENLAESVDWVTKGAVTPVKNQGQCGSCWAFSTTGALEGAHFMSTGKLVSLSESNLVDCSWLNHGCNGGMMDLAFQYAEGHPIELEESYPYVASTGLFACKYKKDLGVVKATGYHDVAKKNPTQLMAALQNGPVSVAIEADQKAFQMYKSGVLPASECGTSLDHGVLVVGYGTENGTDYWKIKNSWGPTWGDQGFIKVERNASSGACGVQNMPSQPVTN